jgi:adenylate cyclase
LGSHCRGYTIYAPDGRKFGHGVLWKILLGKYHLPREEYHVFMFVDLKASTTIAETIGDVKYHSLLHDFSPT